MVDYQPMTLEQRIAALQAENGKLIDSNNALTQTVIGKMGEINHALSDAQQDISEAIVLAGAKTDQAILNFADSHSDLRINYYDRADHSKSSLNIEAEPEAPHISKWVKVPIATQGYYTYPAPQTLTKVHLTRNYSYAPGHYNEPEQYSTDWSRTYTQFILANAEANSDQINAEVERLGLQPRSIGGWNACATTKTIDTIKLHGLHPYSMLFVRFVNILPSPVSSDKTPQNIVEFGGNATFAVDRVINYPRIEV
ncbi:hypothetical protein [Pseudoalteromonas piscicida]|uniref:hypothetical protein n=1 Tax=Pseudoalteromonas piscicida TaxID=43662 RepID=UPI0027E41EBB|nr:hypothetical protein [Pseudoalteromonas piscicida]WMO14314.1 hypothetical protein NI376_01335 [Pseudoalteromonas piscicida]